MNDDNDQLSRRSFLRVAGAAGAAGVAAGCSPKPMAQKLYPYLTPPEDVVPGTPTYYRTLCRGCAAGCGVTAKTREGRVVKLEGNPEDVVSRGALCARGQAALQEVYAPERLTGPMRRGPDGRWAKVSWEVALAEVGGALKGQAGGLRLLTRPEPGSAGALQRAFLTALGAQAEQRLALEPFDLAALRAAGRRLFGKDELPAFDLAAARTVVSFGADFLETWLSPVELTRAFMEGRGKAGTDRTRFTWVGPRLSATGASADEWLSIRPGSERAVVLGILRWLVEGEHGLALSPEEGAALRAWSAPFIAGEVERQSGLAPARLSRLCEALTQRRPSALLGPGPSSTGDDAEELAAAILCVNALLGNVGKTVLYGLDPQADGPATSAQVRALVQEMALGKVTALLVHHVDPLNELPAGLQVEGALAKVPLIVSFSDHFDATTQHAHWVLPDDHALESFGDVTVKKGLVTFGQPAMRRLADTRASSQVLLELGRQMGVALPATDFYDFFQARADALAKADAPAARQRGTCGAPLEPQGARLVSGAGTGFESATAAPVPSALALVPFPTALRGEGRRVGLPWLSEVPDVTSTVSWTAWAELSPSTAKRLGVETGDVVELRTATGSSALTAYVYPGLRDDAVGVPLGGPEALSLVSGGRPKGALAWIGQAVEVRKTGKRAVLPQAEGMPAPVANDLIPHVSPEHPALAPVPHVTGMYPEPEHPKHRWAMTIDLDRCSGCQACVVACYAENNIPVMGPQFAAQGRNMAWLRIERYFEPAADPAQPAGIDFLPMLCQQCGSAPCEPVCPVYATYHTNEGLNAQVYNRCVGTRYCSNNCPYKVRTFNYRDPVFASPLDLQLNPDVSVRSKGVMEKCTFCVQRIRAGENTAKSEGRRVRDGEVIPACAQTCPGQAIVFGDAEDPDSKVSRLRKGGRGFHVLEELNTQPAITYLARTKGGKP